MKDPKTGIEAWVRPFDSKKHYKEYTAPVGSPLNYAGENKCFIEAVTGERFVMGVKIPDDLDFGKSPQIQARYIIDNCDSTAHFVKSKSDLAKNPSFELSALSYDNGQGLFNSGYVFGEVKADENIHHSEEQVIAEVKVRGFIKITIRRGTGTEVDYLDAQHKIEEQSKTSSKKVVIDHGKSHAFSCLNLGGSIPPYKVVQFQPAGRREGERIEFRFNYTSKVFLDKKGMVLRSATGGPEPVELSKEEAKKEEVNEGDNLSKANVDKLQIVSPPPKSDKEMIPIEKDDDDFDKCSTLSGSTATSGSTSEDSSASWSKLNGSKLTSIVTKDKAGTSPNKKIKRSRSRSPAVSAEEFSAMASQINSMEFTLSLLVQNMEVQNSLLASRRSTPSNSKTSSVAE